jgi:hypothetical protein
VLYELFPTNPRHEIRVGALADLVRSKDLLRRAKDIEHLAVLYELFPGLAADTEHWPSDPQ